MGEAFGPEKFAPPHRRGEEQPNDGLRVAYVHKPGQANPSENLTATVQRIASVSMEEIDRLMHALEGMRGLMRAEGDRISREIAGYASLSHSAVTTMRILADSVKEWEGGPNKTVRSEL
jgi:hypothetical protein